MALSDKDDKKRRFIDTELSRNGIEAETLKTGVDRSSLEGPANWYSRLITAYLVLADGEEVEGAFSEYEAGADSARFLIFTETVLIVTNVKGLKSGAPQPTTSVFSRNRLSTMNVAASATLEKSTLKYEWPGTLIVTLTYDGIAPIEFGVASTVEGAPEERTFGRKLVLSLRKDLA